MRYKERFVVGIVVLFVVALMGAIWAVGAVIQTASQSTGITIPFLASYFFGDAAGLSPVDKRVNILVMGMGGGNHDGALLTDTMIVLSFHVEKKTVTMISVPRDIWSEELQDKINSAYMYGEKKKQGGGYVLSKALISDLLGIPIQYAMTVDFSSFEALVDAVGGITVSVEQPFTDSRYPILGKEREVCVSDPTDSCRYETIHFDAGVQMMDGKRALQFVRSRHALGIEGSDFARGKRQQLVLASLQKALLSIVRSADVRKGMRVFSQMARLVHSDMNAAALLSLGTMAYQSSRSEITHVSFEDQLFEPEESIYGGYVLILSDTLPHFHEYIKKRLQ